MGRYTPKQYERKLKRWLRTMDPAVKEALRRGGEIVRREALLKHLSGPKMPKGVGSETSATLARPSGHLAGSIRAYVQKHGGKLHGLVSGGGSGIKYAAVHEYGYKRRGIPERSFLRSSLNAKRKQIMRVLLDGMMDSYRRAG